MFRVITQYNESGRPPVIEKSPWHSSKEIAEYWANVLRNLGYIVRVESQNPDDDNSSNNKKSPSVDEDLAAALAQMA